MKRPRRWPQRWAETRMTTNDPTASDRNERRARLSAAQRALLEKRLRGKGNAAGRRTAEHSAIPPRAPDAPLYAAYAQQRLWYLQQMAPESAAYNMFDAVRLRGAIDIPALERALHTVIQRHAILRTTFATQNGAIVQVIAPELSLPLSVIHVSHQPEANGARREPNAQWERARRLAEAEIRRPFDLTDGPLLRVKLLRPDQADHLLVVVMHHAIADQWSLGVFWRELASAYGALRSGDTLALPDLSIQYVDFAQWQRQRWENGALAEQLAYWQERLGGELPALQLPLDHPRPATQTFRGAQLSAPLVPDVVAALKTLSQEQGATFFMTTLAAFTVLLHRYTGQTDIAIGTPAANRDAPALQALIGLFLNTLVMRIDVADNPPFNQLLTRVRDVALDAYAHRDVPIEKLVEALHPTRDASRNPLFQVMFVHQVLQTEAVAFPELELTSISLDYGAAKFDLTLFLVETPRETRLSIEYNTDLFASATIARMMGHLQTLVTAIAADPAQPIGTLPLLTTTERRQLLIDWNATQVEVPRQRCIHHLIAEHAAATPDAAAVWFENELLTYGELERRAGALAHRLRNLGVGPDICVGICLERSLDRIVAILGVLKAGGAYVPLDPGYPTERLAFMLCDTGAPVLLTHSTLTDRLPDHAAQIVCMDEQTDSDAAENDASLGQTTLPAVAPHHLAYIIYTSGSTGQPKGVAVTHGNLLHSTAARFHYYSEPVTRFLLLSSFAFDSSLVGIFWTLSSGGALVVPRPGTESDVQQLAALIAVQRVTHLLCLPSLYHLLLAYAPPDQLDTLRVAIVAGEACPPGLPARHYATAPQAALYNEYGPTEGTVWSTVYEIPPNHDENASVPIGRPIPNVQIYVLDARRQLVPVGVAGELYIGGAGVARGYVNRPERTAERFVPNPFTGDMGADGAIHSARLYRTGDRVRYRPDGTLEFLGRVDQQVKIRGFRVELGEIEAVLTTHPALQAAVVVAYSADNGNQNNPVEDGVAERLVAYVVRRPVAEPPDAAVLRRYLNQRLPDYMIPMAFVGLDALPLTPNGKVDRQRLPAPDWAAQMPAAAHIAPRDELEIQLARIWESVLDVRPIGVHDNYFDLGGHSLQAVTLFQRLRETLGRDLPLAMLLRAPTIAQQADLLRREGWSPSWASLVPIQPGGSNLPFFCVHAVGGNVLSLRHLAHHLGADQPFYALQSQGLDGKETVPTSVEEMATYYIEEIQTVQPHGPYVLGGQSSGGLVAFEVAQQLRAAGEEVALLALIDSYAPTQPNGAQSVRLTARQRAYFHLRRIKRYGPRYIWQAVHARLVKTRIAVRRGLENRIARAVRMVYRARNRPLPPTLRPTYVRTAIENALSTYRPRVYDGPITLFRATESVQAHLESIYGSQRGWSALTTQDVSIYDIEGRHNLEEEPQVGQVAAILRQCLEKASDR